MSRSQSEALAVLSDGSPSIGWAARAVQQVRRVTRRSAAHTLFLDSDGVCAWAPTARADLASEVNAPIRTTLDAWCKSHPGQAADVVVSGHLLFSLYVDARLPLPDSTALRAYALQQFGHYHGTAAQTWPLALWSQASQRVACALHSLDLPALRSEAETHDVQLRNMIPAWSLALGAAATEVPDLRRGRSAVAWIEGTLVTCMVLDDGALAGLRERFLDAATINCLAALMHELCVELGPFDALPVALGYGLGNGLEHGLDRGSDHASSASRHSTTLPFRALSSLTDHLPSRQWVGMGEGRGEGKGRGAR